MPAKEQAHNSGPSLSGQEAFGPEAPDAEIQKQQRVPARAVQKARLAPRLLMSRDVLQLQRTIGNRAVSRLLATTRPPDQLSAKVSFTNPTSIQRLPEPIDGHDGFYIDSRGGGALRWEGGHTFTEMNDDITLLHRPDTDQYEMADDTFWDPVTGDVFIRKSNALPLYQGMDGRYFYYSGGRYIHMRALEEFLDGVWGLRNTADLLGGGAPSKAALDTIYNTIYSGGANKPMPLHQTQLLIDICQWVIARNGRPQDQANILGQPTHDMNTPLLVLQEPDLYLEDPRNAAYRMVSNNYFFIQINDGIAMNHRIIINALPASVLHVAQTVYGIVSHARYATCVNRFKFAGPGSARTKQDAVIIYCNKNDGAYGHLTGAIQNAGLGAHTAAGIPGLMGQLAAGIGVGDQPNSAQTGRLTFGQKRVSLAVIALRHNSESRERFIETAAVFFRTGGLDVLSPETEHGGATDPRIIQKLVQYEGIFYA